MFALASRRATDRLDDFIGSAASFSPGAAWAWSLGLFTLIFAVDWSTGVHLSLNGFYILPICLAAWSLGTLRGLVVGGLYALTTVSINGFGEAFSTAPDHVPLGVAVWNLFMRAFWESVVVLLVAGFRRSYDRQRHRARTDDLTGALTKHAFADHLARTVAASARRGCSLLLIYSDLDGFKTVNDRHGHDAGDAVLVAFANAAGQAIRSRDVLARMGGDEFVMLLSVDSPDAGFAAAERLHREIGRTLRELPYAVTASMGAVIVARPAAGDTGAFLKMADALMYEVKRGGKDALRVAYVDAPADVPELARAA